MSPLAAAVDLVHSDATQLVGLVGLLQTGHQQLALGDLLRSHVEQLERTLGLRHSSHDGLSVLLQIRPGLFIFEVFDILLSVLRGEGAESDVTLLLEAFSMTAATSIDFRYMI